MSIHPLLNAYDAKRCARRIHNEWDPAIEKVAWEVPAELQMRFDAGRDFERTVLADLKALGVDRCRDVSDVEGKGTRIAATLEAMDQRVEVIIGGWLPDDRDGGRKGRPDLLLRLGEGADLGYLPGEIKGHQVTRAAKRGTLTHSQLDDPASRDSTSGRAAHTTVRLDDYLQLAHYWRMLEAIGRTPTGQSGSPTGVIIGTDDLAELSETGRALIWVDLAAAYFRTYSRTAGTKMRTAMERYDHEQGFRVRVATAAATGAAPLVQPIFTKECDTCPWFDHCLSMVPEGTASAALHSGRLDHREWTALASHGVTTVAELAELDPTEPAFLEAYLPELSHLGKPLDRLSDAVRRARMIRDGVALERETEGAIEVPRADVEIDFDIEWDPADRVYLWGALLNAPGREATYHPIVSWEPLDDEAATSLAEEFAGWLRDQIRAAEDAGRTVRVYHYTAAETTHLKKALGAEAVADLLEHFVDLYPIVARHFFGRDGLGIKSVAPAFGFTWRDEDPGGLQSQLWLLDAREATDEEARDIARRRILDYNEDDVRATAAVREALSREQWERR